MPITLDRIDQLRAIFDTQGWPLEPGSSEHERFLRLVGLLTELDESEQDKLAAPDMLEEVDAVDIKTVIKDRCGGVRVNASRCPLSRVIALCQSESSVGNVVDQCGNE